MNRYALSLVRGSRQLTTSAEQLQQEHKVLTTLPHQLYPSQLAGGTGRSRSSSGRQHRQATALWLG
jgi:hypothetical protein